MVSWSAVRCPHCRESVGFWARLTRPFKQVTRITRLRCHHCRQDVPWDSTTCRNCQRDLSIDGLFEATGFSVGKRMRAYLENVTDISRKRFQRWFLFISGILFWWLMRATVASREDHRHYAILGLFLPFVLLTVIHLTPWKVRMYLVFGTSALFKLAIAINVFNVCMGLRLWIVRFEDQAQVIATLLGVMMASTLLLKVFIVPLWYYLVWLFCFQGFGSTHDPQGGQGHRVREDFR